MPPTSTDEGDSVLRHNAVPPLLNTSTDLSVEVPAAAAAIVHRQHLALAWATSYVQAAAITGESETEEFSRALLQRTGATFAQAANINEPAVGDTVD